MDIKINTHSSIRLACEKKIIYFDPYSIAKRSLDADYVFFTHSHYDHFSKEDVVKVANKSTVFIAPVNMKSEILSLGVKEENLFLLLPYDFLILANIKVQAIPAYNENKSFHEKEKKWLGYILEFNGERVYVAGDTDAVKELKEIKCDVALIPIGGTYTMDYKEGAKLINTIKPKIAIPTHYGNIVGNLSDGEKFTKLIEKGIETKLLIK